MSGGYWISRVKNSVRESGISILTCSNWNVINRCRTIPTGQAPRSGPVAVLSALLDVPLTQAAQNVVPAARTANERVDSLRIWATGRCLDAERGGIYRRDSTNRSR